MVPKNHNQKITHDVVKEYSGIVKIFPFAWAGIRLPAYSPPPGLLFDQLSQSPPVDLPGICNGSPLKRSCELLGALLFIAVVYFAGPQ